MGEHVMSVSAEGVYRLPVTIRSVKDIDRSGHWLSQGWKDFKRVPGISLAYGGAFVLIGVALTFGLAAAGLSSLILPLAGGLVIIAPILVVGLYDVSRRLEAGLPVTLANCFGAFGRSIGQLSAMGVVLLVCYLVWIRVALLLFAVFFSQEPPPLDQFLQDVVFTLDGAPLLILGTIVGALFAAVVFSISAISVPMIYDRPVDVLTAIGVSLLTVRENFKVLFGWAAMVGLLTAVGIATAFIGLAIVIPVLAYSTWHVYRDLIAEGPVYPEDAQNPPPGGTGVATDAEI
jgi:uncharacterized membrane protein